MRSGTKLVVCRFAGTSVFFPTTEAQDTCSGRNVGTGNGTKVMSWKRRSLLARSVNEKRTPATERDFSMKRSKSAIIAMVVFLNLAIGLLTVSLAFAQGTEADAEVDKAIAAEQNGFVEQSGFVEQNVRISSNGGVYPLFMGVDDTTIPAYTMDPTTNISATAFVGAQVWGAAYDPVNNIVYFNSGSTLYEWPVGGAINILGTIEDGTGAGQSMVGLAFHDGQLYGTKNIANEAIYSIDTSTLIATVFIDFADADLDCGGLSADPATGTFYCTNDDATPSGSGLYIINSDGTATFEAAYPSGQVDIDGLAVSDDGVAYLIIDEPGAIYVYDLLLGAYGAPLTNPFTTAEVFAGGAYITSQNGDIGQPAIELTKTVGTDPAVCASTDSVTVVAGTDVTYCYEVTNNRVVTLPVHSLVDDQLGTLLNEFPYDLAPGAGVLLTSTVTANDSIINTAVWTASVYPTRTVSFTDTATVNVVNPSIVMTKTVGTDPATCATTDNITVAAGTDVYYCYTVTNNGDVTLPLHDLVDDKLGTLLDDFAFDLAPSASVNTVAAGLTISVTASASITNTAEWTAFVDENVTASFTDTATVNVVNPSIVMTKTVGMDPATCATTDNITVAAGTDVYYCYTVTNNGDVTLPLHDLVDDKLGTLLDDFAFDLAPSASVNTVAAGAVISATVNASVTNSAVWTAFVDPGVTASFTDTATVTVTPSPAQFTLTVVNDGTGTGTVSSAPAGIDCGTVCSIPFADGTVVTLMAAADSGSTFTGWSGAGCSGKSDCVVTMDAAKNVTATFTADAPGPGIYLPQILN